MHFGPDREDSVGNRGHACPVFVAPSAGWRYLNVEIAVPRNPVWISTMYGYRHVIRHRIATGLDRHGGWLCRRNRRTHGTQPSRGVRGRMPVPRAVRAASAATVSSRPAPWSGVPFPPVRGSHALPFKAPRIFQPVPLVGRPGLACAVDNLHETPAPSLMASWRPSAGRWSHLP